MKVLAAFIFFTRLPFWRIKEVPAKYFKRIVPYWPLAGWLTGSITVGVLWIAAQILPISIASSPDCLSQAVCTKTDWLIFLMALVEAPPKNGHLPL